MVFFSQKISVLNGGSISARLTRDELKTGYPGQWVELFELEWDELELGRRNGVVRHRFQASAVVTLASYLYFFEGKRKGNNRQTLSAIVHTSRSPHCLELVGRRRIDLKF